LSNSRPAGDPIDLKIVVTATVDKLDQPGLVVGRPLLANTAAIRVASDIDVA
jgi:hypothetical protein